jgi:glycosyltransferase involved in cell wall biosynthesis
VIIALMVTKNEADRYLEPALDWLSQQVDQIFVYDDDSTDTTRDIAKNYGCVTRRGRGNPSFLEHEGRFRTNALRSLESVMHPHDGDWIFIADADEFFVPHYEDLHDLIARCQPHHEAVSINIHSVWDQTDGIIRLRYDGPWSTIVAPRLWKWRPHLSFADVPMGCRNEPVFFTQAWGLWERELPTGSAILHYGYASPADRMRRYKRYTALADHGHSSEFIDSIVQEPDALGVWAGEVPCDIR